MKWAAVALSRRLRPTRKPIRRTVLALEELEKRLTPSGTDVLGYHNDNSSTGQNLNELALTPVSVNASTFGKLFSTNVDGQVYAQPLYMENVNITTGPNQGMHNVAFVATEHDSLYAIDASNGTILWHDSLLNPIHGGTVTSVPSSDVNTGDINPEIGITATPVIDAASGLLYVEAKTKEVASDGSHYIHQLYAISINDGSYKEGGPVVIADSIGDTYVSGPTVPGSGDGSSNGIVYFDSLRQHERPGLTEANGNIYLAFASHGDNGPYHGWVLSYNAANLQLNGVLNTTPNGGLGGIWQSGNRLVVDSQGNIYFETGNGTFDTTLNSAGMPSGGDYGDSFVKVAIDPNSTPSNPNINGWGLKVVDYFTPFNQATLNAFDTDLGSSGPVLLPDSVGSAAHPHLLVGSGKEGRIYLIDRDNMGHFDPNTDHVVEETNAGTINGAWSTAAYYNGTIYYIAQSDVGKTFSIANGQMSQAPTSQGPHSYAYPGDTPSISAYGSLNGLVWALDHGSNELRAYSGSGFNTELYTSDQAANGRDVLTGSVVKFTVPTVADGQVFVGSSNALNVYGLLTPATQAPAAPSNLIARTASETSIQLSWTDTSRSPNEAAGFDIEESTDGVHFTQIGMVGVGTTTYTVGGLQVETLYSFRVRAFNVIGDSGYSNTATDTTLSQLRVSGFLSPITAGVTDTFTVAALDANGNFVPDYTGTVHFTSSDLQAVLPVDYTFTAGDQGKHTFTATLKTAGSQSITAADTTSSLTGSDTGILVTPASATKLILSNVPSSTTAGTAFTVKLAAQDTYGNVATGYTGTVHFISSDNKAVLPSDYTFASGDAGQHTFSVTLKTAAPQSFTITDTATSSLTATASNIVVLPAATANFSIAGATNAVTAGSQISFTVTAYDAYANKTPGYLGTIHFTSSDPRAVLPANYTFTAGDLGTHQFSATLTTAGTQSITATDVAQSSLSGSETGIPITPGSAQELVFGTVPSSVTAGTPFTVMLMAIDAYGNVANDYNGTIHFTTSDPEPVLPANYRFAPGNPDQHPFSVTLVTAGTQSLTAADTTTSGFSAIASGIIVNPATASSLNISGLPSPVSAGNAYSITVRAVDIYGNTASDYQGTVHFTSSDANSALPSDYTFAAADHSKHTFTNAVAFGTSGIQTLTATDTSSSRVAGTTTLQVVAPSLTSLSANSAVAGSSDLNLTITGTGFEPFSTVTFGTTTLTPTTVNGPTQLIVTIPASLLAHPGSVAVIVNNPFAAGASGGMASSNAATFTITPSTPTLPGGGSLPTNTTILGVSNQYSGFVQLETVMVSVTNPNGVPVNEGVAAVQVDGQTVYAAVQNGVASATVATGVLDLSLFGDLLSAHPLLVTYSDSKGTFATSGASTSVAPIFLDFLFYELSLQLALLEPFFLT